MSKKNTNPDLLTNFFDHSPNYRNKRNHAYYQFIWLQKKQQFSQIPNFIFNNFMFKPYKLALANLSISLVVIFSLFAFGFSLVTQAQSNPNASLIPNENLDTSRLDECNLDIAFPKRIEGNKTFISAYKDSIRDPEIQKNIGISFPAIEVDTNSDLAGTSFSVGCFNNAKESAAELAKKISYFDSKRDSSSQLNLSLENAKNGIKWKIFDNAAIKNISIIYLKKDYNSNEKYQYQTSEYLTFQIENNTYLISYSKRQRIESENKCDSYGCATLFNYSFTSKLDDIPSEININYNEKNDGVFSIKVDYGDQGYFSTYQGEELSVNYTQEIESQNYRRLSLFFGGYIVFAILSLVFVSYLLKKNKSLKLILEDKLRLTSAIIGLDYLVYLNLFNQFSVNTGYLQGYMTFQLEIAVIFILAGLSTVILIKNWKTLTKKLKFIDLAFVIFYSLYSIISLLEFGFMYLPTGAASNLTLFLAFIVPATFTLVWISYSIWNGYLLISKVFKDRSKL